jgi:hypothetical protein
MIKHNFIGISAHVYKMSEKLFCYKGFVTVFKMFLGKNRKEGNTIQEDWAH